MKELTKWRLAYAMPVWMMLGGAVGFVGTFFRDVSSVWEMRVMFVILIGLGWFGLRNVRREFRKENGANAR